MEFEDFALKAVENGERLDSFASLSAGMGKALDIDFYATHAAVAWLVGMDDQGNFWEGTVRLCRDHDAADWEVSDSTAGRWDGWADIASPRPALTWNDWGSILALGTEGGVGLGYAFQAVRGIAAAEIVGIEFGPKGHTRRRGVDSPTGAFVVAIPLAPRDQSPVLKVMLRGGSVLDLNP